MDFEISNLFVHTIKMYSHMLTIEKFQNIILQKPKMRMAAFNRKERNILKNGFEASRLKNSSKSALLSYLLNIKNYPSVSGAKCIWSELKIRHDESIWQKGTRQAQGHPWNSEVQAESRFQRKRATLLFILKARFDSIRDFILVEVNNACRSFQALLWFYVIIHSLRNNLEDWRTYCFSASRYFQNIYKR